MNSRVEGGEDLGLGNHQATLISTDLRSVRFRCLGRLDLLHGDGRGMSEVFIRGFEQWEDFWNCRFGQGAKIAQSFDCGRWDSILWIIHVRDKQGDSGVRFSMDLA